MMNGADALMTTLADCGIELCLANPGTSELHLVRALDRVPRIRPVLGLFEGVCTGAADGYGRMTGKPAATLLHLGPGLANGIANLHNARRAHSPILNIVGNHPAWHLDKDAPLTSDIDALASHYSAWTRVSNTAHTLAQDGADAVTATLTARPGAAGRIATLITGSDTCWDESTGPAKPNPLPQRKPVSAAAVTAAAQLLSNGKRNALLLAHHALAPAAMDAAGRLAAHCGCRLLTNMFPARLDGGPGRVAVERLPYFPEHVLETLKGTQNLILVGGEAPVSFFAYPAAPGNLVPAGCNTLHFCHEDEDAITALEALAAELGAGNTAPATFQAAAVDKPVGTLNTKTTVYSIACTLPENVIVVADSGGGNLAWPLCQQRAPHAWLSLTGGAIGQGGPCATGAALACPDRRVLALLGDGGAAYTNQCFWTQARENLDVTTVIFANRSYNILKVEYARLGLDEPGPAAASLFDIGNPAIDWVAMAAGMGVPGARASSAEELCRLLEESYRTPGPFVIEAVGGIHR